MSTNLNMIDTLEKDGKFSSFARMLRSSKAADLIAGAGPFTVFAPTNDAFGKIPDAQMNDWLSQTDQIDLAKVLSYHILPLKYFTSKLTSERPVATLSGAELNFSENNGLKVNDAGVLGRNMEATNGIIHAIDTVLTPTARPVAALATAASTVTPVATAVTPTAQADGHSDALTAAPRAMPLAAVKPTTIL